MSLKDKIQNKYNTSLDTRKLEIELFWKRSLFFWGFIGAAFIAYASFAKEGSNLALIIANFGVVCSFAWTMANRGSKYWQENWEKKVEKTEVHITGLLFKCPEEEDKTKFFLYRARKYSVSKLTIALSDYVLFLWSCLVIYETLRLFEINLSYYKGILGVIYSLFTFHYVIIMMGRYGKTSPFNKDIEKCNESDQENDFNT